MIKNKVAIANMGFGIKTWLTKRTSDLAFFTKKRVLKDRGRFCPVCKGTSFSEIYGKQPYWVEMCATCGLGVTMPPNSPHVQTKRHVEVYSGREYPATYLRSYAPYLTNSFNRGLKYLLKHQRTDARLLDVGCGFGFFMQLAKDVGFNVTGLEVSEALAKEGRARYGLNIQSGELLKQDFGDAKFDVVTAWDMLEHCNEPREVMERLLSFVKPNGLLLLRVPDFSFARMDLPETFIDDYVRLCFPFDLDQHSVHFSKESLESLLISNNVKIIEQWPSLADEYTPRESAEYAALLKTMDRLGVACEMNFLVRVEDKDLRATPCAE